MRFLRLRFSVRTFSIAIGVLAVLVVLSIRFGPHVIWRTAFSDISKGVVAIPSQPLVVVPPEEKFVACRVGPLSFMLPEALAGAVEVHHGIGGVFLQFHDDDRSVVVKLPQPDERLLQEEILAYPEKAKQAFPRLYKEIADAQSSDFSWGMSTRELRWHAWLLKNRETITDDVDFIEYLWKPDLEGILIARRSLNIFQWATTDGQWEGDITFKGASSDDVDWIRQVCATFAIEGDPAVLQHRDDAAIRAMVELPNVDSRAERP